MSAVMVVTVLLITLSQAQVSLHIIVILDWSLIGIDSAGEVIAIGRLPVPYIYCAVQYSAGDLDSNPVKLNGIYCSHCAALA